MAELAAELLASVLHAASSDCANPRERRSPRSSHRSADASVRLPWPPSVAVEARRPETSKESRCQSVSVRVWRSRRAAIAALPRSAGRALYLKATALPTRRCKRRSLCRGRRAAPILGFAPGKSYKKQPWARAPWARAPSSTPWSTPTAQHAPRPTNAPRPRAARRPPTTTERSRSRPRSAPPAGKKVPQDAQDVECGTVPRNVKEDTGQHTKTTVNELPRSEDGRRATPTEARSGPLLK